ncbi:MAG TPA: hypothetical protein VG148_06330 [Pyrinomonadaceae bacterium]|nr:hypothetical protein [Pyrinomonadaceae bacterium]
MRNTAHRLRTFLPALLILCCPALAAAQSDYPGPEAFLKSVLQGEDSLSLEARGDLDGDGLADWAGVIHRRRPDSPPTYQLYVLLQARGGGYRVAEKSKEAPVAGAGCCWVEDLEIRRSSIYVQNNAKTAGTMEAATHQFKLHRGGWRLVGLRIYHTDLSADPPASTDADINLLTGSVIEKRQRGDGRPTTTRRRKRFPASFLKDFDFQNGFGTE